MLSSIINTIIKIFMLEFKLWTLLKNNNGVEICSFSLPSLFLNNYNFNFFYATPWIIFSCPKSKWELHLVMPHDFRSSIFEQKPKYLSSAYKMHFMSFWQWICLCIVSSGAWLPYGTWCSFINNIDFNLIYLKVFKPPASVRYLKH